MPAQKILIVGAGVAGSICAFWLGKHGFRVTVIERSKADQKAGQGVEIEEPALGVVKAMGIIDQLEAVKTGEKGFTLVDERSRSYGTLEVGGLSPTGALEMMRGDLTQILSRAADAHANVTYRFETTISALNQTCDACTVELSHRPTGATSTEPFDLVIGADGTWSRTRDLSMGSPEQLQCLHPVGAYVAYFPIPSVPGDWPNSQACHFRNRRFLWLRPRSASSPETSAAAIFLSSHNTALSAANASRDRRAQKRAWADLFADCGWQAPRVRAALLEAENFYSDELVQVKLPKWSKDRVCLLGDAAWAPTPFTGEGNHLAVLSGWVLAQELIRDPSKAAFEAYEMRFRGYVERAQPIPIAGWAPWIFLPQGWVGIWGFRWLFWTVTTVVNLMSSFSSGKKTLDGGHDAAHPPFDLEMTEKGEIA